MELYIFSQHEQPLTIISEDTGLVETHYRIEINSVPAEPFSFTVEANRAIAKHVKEENKVVFKDHEGDWRLMTIKEVDDSNDIDGPITIATCEPAFLAELNDHIVVERRFMEQTADVALTAALQGTRWQSRVEVELGRATTSFYYISGSEAVWKTVEVWGGELKDVVELDEATNKITGCYVKIIQRLGMEQGQRFEIDHNTTEIGRTVLSYPKTALYGQGASLDTEDDEDGYTRYIDFRNVEWKKSNGDPVDKPKGQKWVGDPEALAVYGYENGRKHRFAVFSNQDYEDEESLLHASWEALQKAIQPEVNYRLSVELFNEKVSLGDTCQAIDRKFTRPIEIQARVIAMEYDLMDIEGTMVVEMGQFLDLGDNRLADLEREVERIKNRPPSARIDEGSYPNRKPSRPVNIEIYGGIEVIQLYWDYADELFIKHYEVYGSRTEDFVPDSQHLLWRGKVSAFAHTVGTDEVWYYRVRAVNYHGTPSDWSVQVRGTTHRVISDDILFGEDIAEELRELSKEAKILAEGSVSKEELEKEITDELDEARNRANEAVANANIATENATKAVRGAQEAFDEATVASDEASIAKGIAEATEDLAKAIENTVDGHSTEITATKEALTNKMNTVDANNKFATQSQLTQTSNSLQSRIAEVQWGVDQIPVNANNLLIDKNTAVVGDGVYTGAEELNTDRVTVSIHNSDYHGVWDINYTIFYPDATFENGTFSAMSQPVTIKRNREIHTVLLAIPATITEFYEARVQLEKGDTATPWGMPSQDLITGVKFSEITQTMDSITAEVSKKVDETTYNSFVQQTSQSLSSKISEMDADGRYATQSSLTQTAQGLQTQVNNKVDSSIVTQLAGVVDTKITRNQADGWYASQSQLTQTASSLQSTIKGVRDDLDGLEIADRNLIINSKGDTLDGWFPWGNNISEITNFLGHQWIWVRRTSANNQVGIRTPVFDMKADKTYICSFIIRSRSNSGYTLNYLYLQQSSDSLTTVKRLPNVSMQNSSGFEGDISGDGLRVWFTFSHNEDIAGASLLLAINDRPEGAGFVLREVKVAEGNKLTDWSPAYEDIATQSQFSQLSDAINLRVTKGDVINQINVDTSGILIAGNKVRITGQTTIDNAVIASANIANAAITSAKIASAAVGTAAIQNAAITKAKLGTAVVGTAQIENAAITNAKIASVNADKISAASLSAITANLGTVTAGRLRSSNNNMDLSLNTGLLIMQNTEFRLSSGADIQFMNAGNRLYFNNGVNGAAGLGVGRSINNTFPLAYLGTTSTNHLSATDSSNFSGFIANRMQRYWEDGIGNSVIGHRFDVRNVAVGFDYGFTFQIQGTRKVMRGLSSNDYNYYLGDQNQELEGVYTKTLYSSTGTIRLRSGVSGYSQRGFTAELTYTNGLMHFRGTHSSENHALGRPSWRFQELYLSNPPNVSSDERLKENIRVNPLGLDFIKRVDTKLFNFKRASNALGYKPIQLGIIAQQLLPVLEAYGMEHTKHSILTLDEDGYYGVKYEQFTIPTIKAIQELDTKVGNLDTKVDNEILKLRKEKEELVFKVAKLEQRLHKLEVSE
ncbi:phage tail spike protein [Oceanobacillus sp. CFH 90083]|uniref:phage tail spike protein n=1 Tax=Oceanobacillus sp. CFH 90083 TaxID=2592336 RepID=UPI00128E172C|nr:phage tail spike protein [Oceanobacillus sp. CFH 90083]